MPLRKHLVVLSGSGISQESGLATFRDSGGLWEGYDINEVASINGWYADPQKVLEFYNLRRKQAADSVPNEAHKAFATLEEQYDVSIVTQNVDNLHERGGSSNVLHLHGELTKVRSVASDSEVFDIGSKEIHLGDTAPDGHQLRPYIVWFGEMVPMLEQAAEVVAKADILVVIGTSLVVYPAAGLVDYAQPDIPKYIIDPATPELLSYQEWTHIKEKAVTGTQKLLDFLL